MPILAPSAAASDEERVSGGINFAHPEKAAACLSVLGVGTGLAARASEFGQQAVCQSQINSRRSFSRSCVFAIAPRDDVESGARASIPQLF